MGASITLAGESLIAQKLGAQQNLNVVRFILANVPGLDTNGPVNRSAGKPPASQIVGSFAVTQKGYVNPNQVVYSLMMGSDIGDFDWNWIGLETAENVLLAISYLPIQQKRRNIPPQQVGNNVTRNFLVVFDGAQSLTGITVDASTWQHDFTVRFKGVDERERLSNRDLFGHSCFFSEAFKVVPIGSGYQVSPGKAYVEGIRLAQIEALPVSLPALPIVVYLDVVLHREFSDVVARWQVVTGEGLTDYLDPLGLLHYRVPLAEVSTASKITDLRVVEQGAEALVRELARRDGDYSQLRARATTKDDVGLGHLPNALSSEIESDDSQVLATTHMVTKVRQSLDETIREKLPLAGGTMLGAIRYEADNYTFGWARGFDFTVNGKTAAGMGGYGNSGTVTALYMALGDKPYSVGNGIRITETGVDIVGTISGSGSKLTDLKAESLTGKVASERLSGTYSIDIDGKASSASKLVTSRKINSVAFDGSADITIYDDTKLSLSGGVMKGDVGYSGKNFAGGWARGLSYETQGAMSGGIGGMGGSDTFQLLYMALGPTPYVSGSGLRITPGSVSFEGKMSGNAAGLTNLPQATPEVPGAVLRNTASLGVNGWWKCAQTGFIKQWGFTAGASDTVTHRSFPIAFPNRCTSLVASRTSLFYSDVATGTNTLIVSNSQFSVISGPFNSPDEIYWEATGY